MPANHQFHTKEYNLRVDLFSQRNRMAEKCTTRRNPVIQLVELFTDEPFDRSRLSSSIRFSHSLRKSFAAP